MDSRTPTDTELHAADLTVLEVIARGVIDRRGAEGWTVRPQDFWCYVEPPGREHRAQGWKLHVSATPLSAPIVLARAAEVLVSRNCHFKFAATLEQVGILVAGDVNRGNGGKFITVYPDSDEDFRSVAEELHAATRGLPGPKILSDRQWCDDSLVHFRYGAFSGVSVLTNDGTFESVLLSPEGEPLKDERNAWFSPPAWAGSPIEGGPVLRTAAKPSAVLLGDRFEVVSAIRHSNKGGVYRAHDRVDGADVIIKRGRPHVSSTLLGTDVRDLLRNEAAVIDLLRPSGVAAKKVALFEQQGSLFLATELLPGSNLRKWVGDRIFADGSDTPLPLAEAVPLANRLISLMEAAHEAGVVLRDFTPNNIMVLPDGELRLIDLEHAIAPGTFTGRAFTRGYAAPEYEATPALGPAPEVTADLYSLGTTLFHLLSGIDPVLTADLPESRSHQDRLGEMMSLIAESNPALRAFLPVIFGLVADTPEARWNLQQVREAVAGIAEDDDAGARPSGGGNGFSSAAQERAIRDGLSVLLETMAPTEVRLWPDSAFGTTADPCNVQQGAAGVLGVLTRAAALYRTDDLRAGVRAVADWIDGRRLAMPRLLPGLYFGRAGTAWSLFDAARSTGDEQLAERAVALLKELPLEWENPDVCHGLAGAGMAHLHMWQATGDAELRDRAVRCADAVLAAVRIRDGRTVWPIPATFDSTLAGLVHYGFGHGVAGVGTFLLGAWTATGDRRYLDAARAAGDTLAATAIIGHGAVSWAAGPDTAPDRTRHMWHWCSGASGIGTFLIRLWQATGDDGHRDLAQMAAVEVHRRRFHALPAACHGLAGDGEFLLDLAAATGDDEYRVWAADLAAAAYMRHGLWDGRMVVGGEDPQEVLYGYNTGLAGVVGFLLRLRHGGPRWWMVDGLVPEAGAGERRPRPTGGDR